MSLKYIGDGTYIIGVPARDLDDAEARTHGALIREQEKATGMKLYERVAKDEAPAREEKPAKPDKPAEKEG